jgi:2-methylcitrate dehydratase
MMSTLGRSACRNVSRTLRPGAAPRRIVAQTARSLAAVQVSSGYLKFIKPLDSQTFSTMPTLRDQVTAVPASANQFDQEIADVASYVHNYQVNSELAVSGQLAQRYPWTCNG